MTRSRHLHTRAARATTLITLCALLTPACGDEAEDPTVAAAAELQQLLDIDGGLDAASPAETSGARSPALACDPEPGLVLVEVCGQSFTAEAHHAWTDCAVAATDDRPEISSSGAVDLTREVAADAACDGPITLTETAEFHVTLALPMGEATLVGSSTAVTQRAADAAAFTRQAHITAERTFTRDDETRTTAIAGDLEIAVELAADGPIRTVDGALTRSSDDDDATVTLTGVVHAPLSACPWPLAGRIDRALADGDSHTLVFGPTCGAATLDGEAVDLDDMHARGRRGHRRG